MKNSKFFCKSVLACVLTVLVASPAVLAAESKTTEKKGFFGGFLGKKEAATTAEESTNAMVEAKYEDAKISETKEMSADDTLGGGGGGGGLVDTTITPPNLTALTPGGGQINPVGANNLNPTATNAAILQGSQVANPNAAAMRPPAGPPQGALNPPRAPSTEGLSPNSERSRGNL